MNNSEAKNAIFASIRQHLAASLPFDAAHHAHHGQTDADFKALVRNDFSKEALIENFRESLEFVGGNFSHVFDETQAAEVLFSIIKEKNARKIAISDSPQVRKIAGYLKIDAEFIENAPADVLFESDLGVTS